MFNHCIDWRHLASAVVPIAQVHLLLGGVPFTCHGSVAHLSLTLARYGWRWFTWAHGSSTCVLGVCRYTRTHQFTRSVPADLVRVGLLYPQMSSEVTHAPFVAPPFVIGWHKQCTLLPLFSEELIVILVRVILV